MIMVWVRVRIWDRVRVTVRVIVTVRVSAWFDLGFMVRLSLEL